jgi:uncharacterized membrane protein YkvA (DUF1232 family)
MWKLILLILAVLYTLNPYDIVPDILVGWGWLDDLIIWGLLWRYFVSLKKKSSDYNRFYQQAGSRFENRSASQGQYSEDKVPWDPYRILGIDRSASAAEIKHAYRELANKYHPDKLEHLGNEFKELAEMRFKEIQRAYHELAGK